LQAISWAKRLRAEIHIDKRLSDLRSKDGKANHEPSNDRAGEPVYVRPGNRRAIAI
jgi:hypothetical protein